MQPGRVELARTGLAKLVHIRLDLTATSTGATRRTRQHSDDESLPDEWQAPEAGVCRLATCRYGVESICMCQSAVAGQVPCRLPAAGLRAAEALLRGLRRPTSPKGASLIVDRIAAFGHCAHGIERLQHAGEMCCTRFCARAFCASPQPHRTNFVMPLHSFGAHERRYTLTNGIKFGGHFLAYQGDPGHRACGLCGACTSRRYQNERRDG